MKITLRPIILFLIVLAILPDSTSAQNIEINQNHQSFTMIIASDPQLYRWRDWKKNKINCNNQDYMKYKIPESCKDDCKSNDCIKDMAIATNEWQVKAMNDIETVNDGYWPETDVLGNNSMIKKPEGVIMNGDLMAWDRNLKIKEYTQYKKYYDPKPKDKNGDNVYLKYPIFPGLGNHDLMGIDNTKNRINITNAHAARSIKYIKRWNENPPANTVTRFHKGSLSYSFNIEGYHFIQLHNNPDYKTEFKHLTNYKVKKSYKWLEKDIRIANNNGYKIVINMHNYEYKKFNKGQNARFKRAIKGKNVVAIFAGHLHQKNGRQEYLEVDLSEKIPVFLSGSSEYNTFLLVDFGPSSMTVGVIKRNPINGNAIFQNPNKDKNLNTYSFANIE